MPIDNHKKSNNSEATEVLPTDSPDGLAVGNDVKTKNPPLPLTLGLITHVAKAVFQAMKNNLFRTPPPPNLRKHIILTDYRGIINTTLAEVPALTLERYGLAYEDFEAQTDVQNAIEYYRTAPLLVRKSKNLKKFRTELEEEWKIKFPHIPFARVIASKEYSFNFNRPHQCLIETFPETEKSSDGKNLFQADEGSLLGTLYRHAHKLYHPKDFPSFENRTRVLSLYEIEALIQMAEHATLCEMGLNPHQFRIVPISHELYLLMAQKKQWGIKYPTLINKRFSLKNGFYASVLAGGGKQSGAASTNVVCCWPHSLPHQGLCSGNHSMGLIRLVVVPG